LLPINAEEAANASLFLLACGKPVHMYVSQFFKMKAGMKNMKTP
jgi:hypothetical protein